MERVLLLPSQSSLKQQQLSQKSPSHYKVTVTSIKKRCTFSPAGASCSMWCQAGTPRPAPSRALARAAARARPATRRAGKARCPCPAALVAAHSCPRPTCRSARRSPPTEQAARYAGRPPARGWRAAGSARGRRRRAAPRAPRCPAARVPACRNVADGKWRGLARHPTARATAGSATDAAARARAGWATEAAR